ncbi:MAG TPA: hypothetical protein VLI44_10150, partial [Sporolactobacillaceae bacterium]|nr:hypothetical protein [Sporolactobacillaceae bacterium]
QHQENQHEGGQRREYVLFAVGNCGHHDPNPAPSGCALSSNDPICWWFRQAGQFCNRAIGFSPYPVRRIRAADVSGIAI